MKANAIRVAVGVVAGILLTLLWQRQGGPTLLNESRRQPLYWVAPMDANYRRDEPGKSPMGMDLIPVYDEPQGAKGEVKVSAQLAHNMAVRTAFVQSQPLSQTIHTFGSVGFDEARISHVHPRVEGWVQSLAVNAVGERVEAGQSLFEFYAPDLVSAQEEYVLAAKANNRRLLAASLRRLRLLGLGESAIQRLVNTGKVLERVPVYADIEGVVSTLAVREGSYVGPSTEILAIAPLDTVWVTAEVLQRQADWLAPNQAVTMTVEGLSGRQWHGQVSYIYPALDTQLRTVQVRVQLQNQDLSLKPNMLARLSIAAGSMQERLLIPREALIRTGRGDRVVQQLDAERYRSVVVQVGIENGHQVEILSGLASGQKVVISGQFLIDSESNIDADLGRLDGPPVAGTCEPPQRWLAATWLGREQEQVLLAHEGVVDWQWPAGSQLFQLQGALSDELNTLQVVQACVDEMAQLQGLGTSESGGH